MNNPSPQPPPYWPRWLRWLAWGVAVVVCLGVFALYSVPEFMVMLADQVWACF